MDNKEFVEILNENYSVITKIIPSSDNKLYHLKTIKNFIIHFNALKSEDKPIVFDQLNEYFIFIKPLEIDNESSKQLYREFIYPIATKYYYDLGFIVYARWQVLYGMFALLLSILYFLNTPTLAYIAIFALFAIIHIRILKKKNDNKVYGFGY